MKLKVISFNIRCVDDKDGHSVAERGPRLKTVVAPYDADIMGFQEYTPLWEDHIAALFDDKYEIFNKYRTLTGWVESAPILWKKDKFECLNKGYFWLSDTPEVESRGWDTLGCCRMCEYVVLKDKTSGESFVAMNTHFGFGDECQIKSSALMAKHAKDISTLPTFVTGDFNMTPGSAGYAEITKHFADSNMLTSKDTRATFHGYAPEKNLDEHIDYCFVGDGVTPTHRELLDKTFDGKYPSDHYGVFVKLDI